MPNQDKIGPGSTRLFPVAFAILLISSVLSSVMLCGNESESSPHTKLTSNPVKHNTVAGSKVESTVQWEWIGQVRKIHPLVFAAAMLLAVIGTCLLLTDNKELELYLKIDFRPPKVDILN